jgi:hypothetical protein
MKDYLLVYRADFNFMPERTAEEMAANTKRWMDWIGSIAAQNKLTDRGNRLDVSGKVINKDSTITNGPYAEIKESIAGFIIVKAESFEEAVGMAKDCPILQGEGNSVEVRKIVSVHNKA